MQANKAANSPLIFSDYFFLFALEFQRVALSALYAFVTPTATAKSHIAVIAANLNLVTIGNYIALSINASIDACFATASASRFYLFYRIGNLKQTT